VPVGARSAGLPGRVPHVRLHLNARHDAAGGQGIAVTMTGRATVAAPAANASLGPVMRYELIFDPHTYRLIGLQEVTAGGIVHNAEAVISARVADTAPKTDSPAVWEALAPCIA
jgi:hypothetical protein